MSGFATIEYLSAYPHLFLLVMVMTFAVSFRMMRNGAFGSPSMAWIASARRFCIAAAGISPSMRSTPAGPGADHLRNFSPDATATATPTDSMVFPSPRGPYSMARPCCGKIGFSKNCRGGMLSARKSCTSTDFNVGRLRLVAIHRSRSSSSSPESLSTNIDPLKAGSVDVPMNGNPSPTPQMLTATFRGCMEERSTYEIDDYNNVDLSKALDLDLDLVPTPGDQDTQWRPLLHEISFEPEIYWNGSGSFKSPVTSDNNYLMAGWAGLSACPAPARKLTEMSKAEVDNYLGTLAARGSTYHDIGMIWGGRMLSPTGIFANENADVSGKPTNRNMIFLTDGLTAPLDLSYGTYGIEPLDKRRWNAKSPIGGLTLTNVVEKRFTVACNEVKKRNITVWIIGFGTTLNPIMTECAGPGHFYEAKTV